MSAGGCATLLWIHGGGYSIGSGINYDGSLDAALAADVVIVTTNYRLSVLGFAATPVDKAGDSTANFGLLDQQASMRWLRTNAASFGGDATKLTIFGQSAGATSVTCQLCSPGSRSLFSRAMMESGAFAYWAARPMATAVAEYATLLNATRCASVQCLRGLNASALVALAANRSLFAGIADKRYASSWAPTVDGVALLDLPGASLQRGACAKVPLLLGVNRDEGTLAVGMPDEPGLALGYNMSAHDLHAFFARWLRNNATRVAEASSLYAVGSSPLYSRPYWSATHFVGDLMFTCPAIRAARHYADA